MIKSDKFTWGSVENASWEAIKLRISLEFENCPLDPNKPLFITIDSSQIARCYLLFQLDDDGYIKMVFTKSKIFDMSTRNKPSVLRELTGLTYLLVQEELTLKDHKQSIFLLTDCSSLAYLQRNRFADHKLGEVAIFLNTFRNLNVYYAPGQSLF